MKPIKTFHNLKRMNDSKKIIPTANTKARVLPEPVLAAARISRPQRAWGITALWISVIVLYLDFSKPERNQNTTKLTLLWPLWEGKPIKLKGCFSCCQLINCLYYKRKKGQEEQTPHFGMILRTALVSSGTSTPGTGKLLSCPLDLGALFLELAFGFIVREKAQAYSNSAQMILFLVNVNDSLRW